MKKVIWIFVFAVLGMTAACDKAEDGTSQRPDDITAVSSENSEVPPDSDEEEEPPLEEEVDDETMANANNKYCIWTVSRVDGNNCKFKVGDEICYLCDDNGCSSDRGPIVLGGRNFGDGCRTYGTTTDYDCKKRNNCAGKYYRR